MVAQVSDWHGQWGEPVRIRSRHPSLDHFNRASQVWFAGSGQLLYGWYQPFSEPVRSKLPLPRGAIPHLFELLNYAQFSFTLRETADTITTTMNEYVFRPKSNVSVSITERKVGELARVSITDLKDYNP